MAALIQYVRIDGSGDYTDFVTGVSGILASGLAATGIYDEYYLHVDDAQYSGNFDAYVPYSGALYIMGSGTWFYPDGISVISGSMDGARHSVTINDMIIDADAADDGVFTVLSGAGFGLEDVHLLRVTSGIINSGIFTADDSSAHSLSLAKMGYFLYDHNNSALSNTKIANFHVGVYSTHLSVNNVELVGNGVGLHVCGTLLMSDSLLRDSTSGVVAESFASGLVSIRQSSIESDSPVHSSGNVIQVERSILHSDGGYSITGIPEATSTVDNSVLYPSGWASVNISGTQNVYQDPQWYNPNYGDMSLRMKHTDGSPAVDIADRGELSGVTVVADQSQILLKDKTGRTVQHDFLDYMYLQGHTVRFTDFDKEVAFANTMARYGDMSFEAYMRLDFSVSGIPVKSALSLDQTNDPFPWDWDQKVFPSTRVLEEHENEFIIPRSVLDVKEAIRPNVGNLVDSTLFEQFTKDAVQPYLYGDYRGVAYDYDASLPGEPIVWMLEGRNQTLIKMNAYTAERLEEYPLFVPDTAAKPLVVLSGLIPGGVYKDKWKFLLESNPSEEYFADTENGRFPWIPTHLDLQKDVRGAVAYKGNIFITASEYSQELYNRESLPTASGVGKVLMYHNNDNFEHYIANYTTSTVGPTEFALASGNAYPTDLTIYEDGSLWVLDYTSINDIFKYKFAYDYALIQSRYDSQSRILLREQYDEVEV